MTTVKVELKNIRKMESRVDEFNSGNLYLIKGKNGTNKTTFTNAVRAVLTGDVPKDMITTGKDDGSIVGVVRGRDGTTYKVIINLKKDKSPSFKIIDSDLNVSNKKTDLARIFNRIDFTVEEFLGWGYTTEGRKKQGDMLLNILPKEVQEEIKEIDELISTKDNGKSIFVERKTKGILLRNLSIPPQPSEKDIEIDGKLDEWKERYAKTQVEYNKKVEAVNTWKIKNTTDLSKKETLSNSIERTKKEIEEMEELLKRKKEQLRIDEETLSGLVIVPPPYSADEMEKDKINISKGAEVIKHAENIRSKVEAYKEADKKRKELQEAYNNLTEEIESKRAKKKELIKENLHIDQLVIDDDGLKIEEDGTLYDFTEKTISYSVAAKKLLEILIMLNPEYPIAVLGKARELDPNTIKEMKRIAKETESIIIADYVVGDVDKLTIECYEEED